MGAKAVKSMPVTARGEATRARILKAAEQEFGEHGFHAASVARITQNCKVAQGTFYIYFSSREEIFTELVRDIGRQLRHEMREAAMQGSNRMDAERRGLQAFVSFVSRHPRLYRIVQQAQFVDETLFRAYYCDIAGAYADLLNDAADRGELSPGDGEVRAWAIMGIGHFLGLRYCLWQDGAPEEQVFDEVMKFIGSGMAAPGRGS